MTIPQDSIAPLFINWHYPSHGTGMCLDWRRICHKRDTPTPPPNAPCTHAHRWRPMRLMAPLCNPQPDTYSPSWCPPIECEGVSCWQALPSLKLEGSWRGSLFCRIRDFGYITCRLLRGQMRIGGGQGMASFLGRRWNWGQGGACYGSPQKPIKTFHLQACHCHFHFSQPFSLQLLGLFFKLAGLLFQAASPFLTDPTPERNKKKEEYRNRNVKWKKKHQLKQKAMWMSGREKKPTSCNNPHASSSGHAGKPSMCTQL